MFSRFAYLSGVLLIALLPAMSLFAGSVDLDELYPDPDFSAVETTPELPETPEPEMDMEIQPSVQDDTAAIDDLLQESFSGALLKDVVMVLDNSGSMKKNDPDFLVTKAVSEFISSLDSQTRIAVVIFDQNISLAVPLTTLSTEARDTVLSALDKVNYKGLFTDSPAAIERAIYELKNNGRDGAQKSIVFMTDGIVDTGKADVDLEKSKWLKEDLAADAAEEGIKVFGIAFTEAADFQLIQSIAQQTDGEYFRALQASDLQKVFTQVNDIINEPPEPDVTLLPEIAPEPTPVAPAVQTPVIIEVPAQADTGMSDEERLRSTIMIVAASVLFITLLAIVYLLLRRSRQIDEKSNAVVADAFINDIHGITSASQYQLGQKPTMFGRVAGKDTDHLNYLVVPESTIGRRHALIEYKDYGFWISDQGSINGTFVNDNLISSEVCLKHGDKVRLHKFEFEFVMPEMDDAGMTVISNTTFAAPADNADAATEIRGADMPQAEDIDLEEPDFDITGGVGNDFEIDIPEDDDDDEEETIIRGDGGDDEPGNVTDPGNEGESEDETLIPGAGGLEADLTLDDDPTEGGEENDEDETLMRGDFISDEDEDLTIRKDADEAIDDFFDIGDDQDDQNKS